MKGKGGLDGWRGLAVDVLGFWRGVKDIKVDGAVVEI